jgi:hypothetical protein
MMVGYAEELVSAQIGLRALHAAPIIYDIRHK